MTWYKAMKKGMVCRDKQYKENTDYEENGASSCCNSGVMHFCKDPMDVLNYYPLVDENGDFSEFVEVEPLDEVLQNGDKYASKKIHIGAKLGFKGFIEAAVDFLIEKTNHKVRNKNTDNAAQIGSSGKYAKIGSSGYAAKIGSSGDAAKIGSSGYAAQIGSSGYAAQIGSSGDAAQIGSSGDAAKIGSSGDAAQIGSSGKYAKIGSSGDNAIIKCESDHAVVVCAGKRAKVKAPIGTWITLAEYGGWNGEGYPCICVKSAKIDGEKLKADTLYTLKDGEFTEANDDD